MEMREQVIEEVISTGSIIDIDVDVKYLIKTYTIRLTPEGINEWIDTEPEKIYPEDGYTEEEVEEVEKEEKMRLQSREALLSKIEQEIGFVKSDCKTITIKQIISEFFAIVTIQKIKKNILT